MALARVSVIRGEGEETGVPFIDDYIQVNEPIVDYLTEFSGIRRGSPFIFQS
jgi:PAB-dependent poly(A)-specific ribonuclease subunit 2